MKKLMMTALAVVFLRPSLGGAQRYTGSDGKLRVALAQQPFSPNGTSPGPRTMAQGGIQRILGDLGATVRVQEAALTPDENTEYGGWKRLGMALGHFGELVTANERDGYFTVGLYATCPSMPGMVAGLQHSGPTREPIRIGMLWLDAHPDFNTPETTRSGSLGGMPVAVATGRALQGMRLDARLDLPLSDTHVVMGGVRLTDPLEQQLLDNSRIEQLAVDDLRHATPAVFAQLDRLNRITDKIYVHIDMDVLDEREVIAHQNKVPGGPTSQELAALFEAIFSRYPNASAIGFATIPSPDEGGLALAAVNRMIAGAVRGVKARETRRPAALWQAQTSGVTGRLRGVSAVSSRIAWTSGASGTVLRTTDGGENWHLLPVPGAETLDFRDVDAMSDRVAYALSIGAGASSRIYKTADGGAHWDLQFANTDPQVFLDAMVFRDEAHGIALSDSVDGRFVILTTADGGRTWERVPADHLPPALPGEGAFAASGTNVALFGSNDVWIGTTASRVLHSSDGGRAWTVATTPVATGTATGIFSITFRDAQHGVVVGGDYRNEPQALDNAALTSDGGKTWTLVTDHGLSGFRSVVAWAPREKRSLIAIGPSGADWSSDEGRTWTPLQADGFDTFSFAPGGTVGWAAGQRGRISKLTLAER